MKKTLLSLFILFTSIIYSQGNPCALNVTATNKPILCKGDTASLTISVSGGSGSYLYSLNGGTFTNNEYYPNLPGGAYNIAVKDVADNCTTSINYTIIEPTVLSATSVISNQYTYIDATGGKAPYRFSLDGGLTEQDSNVFQNLAPGTYNILVMDVNGCSTTVKTTILAPLTSSMTITRELTCSMDYVNIMVNAAGGKAPYTYSVGGKPYQASNLFYDLLAGYHSISVKDALGTSDSKTVFIVPYLPFHASSTVTAESCYGANDGNVEITAVGGRTPYTYSIDHGPFVSGNIFNNLSAGYHTAVVKDAVGCYTDGFDIEIKQANSISVNENIKNAGANNNDGEITITASRGVAPYSYSLSDNTGTVLRGPQTSNFFSGLSAGSYQVQVTDSKGCFSTRSNIKIIVSTLAANLAVESVTCNSPKGSITVTPTGGVAPYQYSLNDGAYSSVNVFTNLTPKTYTVKVRDAESTRIVLYATVTQSTLLTLSTKVSVPIFCAGDSSGVIISTPSGGKSPYTYSIDGVTFQSSRYFENLKIGTYNITTKDANGCVAMSSIVLTEPSPLKATYEIVNDQNIFVHASGGSNLYTYFVTNTTTGIEYGPEGIGTFTKLPPGIYTVTVGDSNGCRFSQTGVKIEASQSTALSAVSIVDPPGCVSTGRITVDAMGGKAPYQYSIDNGTNYSSSNLFTHIVSNTYIVKVKDADSNTTTHTIVIDPVPAPPTIEAVVKNVTCQGLKNGSITVKASGGTGNYGYTLNNEISQNFDTFSNLGAGVYTIEVFDMNICKSTITMVLTEPLALSATPTVDINKNLTINVTGGSAPYSYSLENNNGVVVAGPQSSNVFPNLANGLYTLKVIDVNACNVTVPNINVVPVTELIASANTTNISCNNPTGKIAIEATGGIAPYQYSLDSGAYVSSNLFENLAAKNYTVKIKDAQNTIVTLDATIVKTTAMSVSAVAEVDIKCAGSNTGLVNVTAKGGTAPYTYSINGTNFQSSKYFENLSAGNYNITTKDNNGCLAVTSIQLSEPAPLSATYEIVNEENIVITSTGGNNYYTYYLENAATGIKVGPDHTGRFTKLAVGTYNVIIYSSDCNFSITGIKIEPSTSTNLTLAAFADPVTCSDRGRIILIAKGGKAPYQYSLNNGETYSSSNTFVGLTANYTYPVIVRDADLNIVTAMVPMKYIGESVTKINTVVTDVSCAGNNDGKIEITTTDGIGTYSYSINGGIPGNSGTFEKLAPGNYLITMFGVNICDRFFEVVVKEPAKLVAAVTVGNDQSITVNATGGSAPYSYTLENDNGATVAGPQVSNTFTNLEAGLYRLKVISANGCYTRLYDINVIDVPELAATATITNITCTTGGTITVNATGGTGIYQYSKDGGTTYSSSNIFTNLTAGSYTIKVKDSQNNVFSTSVEITATQPLQLVATITAQQTCSNPATITATVAGGQAPYLYSLNGGVYSASNTFNVYSGTHIIKTKDSNGCEVMISVITTEPTPLTADFNVENQKVTVIAHAGTAPYLYAISPNLDKFSPNNIFTDLIPGMYSVIVVDASGCTVSYDVTINPPAPSIDGKDNLTVEFTKGQTLGDLIVEGENIKWYSSQNNLTNKTAEATLPLTTLLVDGITYYASQTINGIESKERLAVTVKLKGELSTPDFDLANFKYSPNPVKHVLTIDHTTIIDEVHVFSVSGKSVLVKKINNTHSEIDLSNLSTGIYILKVKSDGKEKTIKIMKE